MWYVGKLRSRHSWWMEDWRRTTSPKIRRCFDDEKSNDTLSEIALQWIYLTYAEERHPHLRTADDDSRLQEIKYLLGSKYHALWYLIANSVLYKSFHFSFHDTSQLSCLLWQFRLLFVPFGQFPPTKLTGLVPVCSSDWNSLQLVLCCSCDSLQGPANIFDCYSNEFGEFLITSKAKIGTLSACRARTV